MFHRRTAIAAAPLIAGLAVGVAAPASAASGSGTDHRAVMRAASQMKTNSTGAAYGSCSLVVPARVNVQKKYTEVPVSATGGCALHTGFKGIWYVGPSLAVSADSVLFSNSLRSTWDVTVGTQIGDTLPETPLGTRTWKGWAAIDGNNNSYTQNVPQTTVKVASYAGLRASRANGKTTLDARVVRYATSYYRNIPYAGETGIIQYRPVGGSAWTGLKNIVADSQGKSSYTYSTSQTREYRVAYNETTYIWGTDSVVRTS